jgi:hypothetical protein
MKGAHARTKNAKRIRFSVSFELPEDASVAEARIYVMEAVRSWSGSLCPPGSSNGDYPPTINDGDPMYNLKADTVRVVVVRP